jgi:uncharacterized protein YndB with AHSA1/START domain
MAQFSMTKRIDAPLETVFEAAIDLERAAEHIRGIEKIELVTTLPVRVGTRWRETRKVMGRQDMQTLEVTAFNPPHSYTVGCDSCGSYFETTFRFEPAAGNSTDVMLDVRCEARSLLARLLSPIGNLMFGRVMRNCLDDDLDDIRRVAESKAAAAT